MTVEPVARSRVQRYDTYRTICGTCGGEALAYGGGSLWCRRCLDPLIRKGKSFKPSLTVRKAAG